jgi:phage terminase large subunit-like protein
LPLSDAEREVYIKVAGERPLPRRRARELWAIIGRRSGKSRVAAGIACYEALFVPRQLAPGETGTVAVCAASQSQAQMVFNYCEGFLRAAPVLEAEVESVVMTQGFFEPTIRLKNGNVICVLSNNFRRVRGRTLLCCIFDEVAFWRDEASATPEHATARSCGRASRCRPGAAPPMGHSRQ